MTDWYLLPHKTALGFILIISRSSMVIKLTAGKLVHLSIATFGSVSAYEDVTFYNHIFYIENVSGDEDLHDVFKHAPNYDSFVDNYIILYKTLANSLVVTTLHIVFTLDNINSHIKT